MKQKLYYVWRETEEDRRYFCIIQRLDSKKRVVEAHTFSFCPSKLSCHFSDYNALPAKETKEIRYSDFIAAYNAYLQTIQTQITL